MLSPLLHHRDEGGGEAGGVGVRGGVHLLPTLNLQPEWCAKVMATQYMGGPKAEILTWRPHRVGGHADPAIADNELYGL